MSKGTGPLSTLYNSIINNVGKVVPAPLTPLWESPAGPKTVFFWAPLFKWGLVAAGFSDVLNRPPQNISLNQCAVIATTGLLWSRYSVVIVPKNYSLLSVNVVVFLTQGFLVYKALKWRRENASKAEYKHPYFPSPMEDEW
ncbi:mitochondrial pyruvate carrier 2-like [Scaptodrosophila lebanonensis]|uniref:Mitochondrial pyruvate carrier n=1 Tax=Drosophila lebanonensis TaxID=7225 RepID=A0A6J2U449_DROLE|nr:mitochondrial pyruvate carrier 2-like [Scaptodrosophila lebanonensis]